MQFDYGGIPAGYYDQILLGKDGPRKFWHWHKFNSVMRMITAERTRMRLLDVGCFSGSFAGRFLSESLFESTSLDILPAQITYAKERFETATRRFKHYDGFHKLVEAAGTEPFDVVTLIEVIEHLTPEQIREFFLAIDRLTRPGSQVIVSTPNYVSVWPVLELILNQMSDVKYEEQHITKFSYWNFSGKLQSIYPSFREQYEVELITTSHLLSPFVSAFNYRWAQAISKVIRPERWMAPFGALVMMRLRKKQSPVLNSKER